MLERQKSCFTRSGNPWSLHGLKLLILPLLPLNQEQVVFSIPNTIRNVPSISQEFCVRVVGTLASWKVSSQYVISRDEPQKKLTSRVYRPRKFVHVTRRPPAHTPAPDARWRSNAPRASKSCHWQTNKTADTKIFPFIPTQTWNFFPKTCGSEVESRLNLAWVQGLMLPRKFSQKCPTLGKVGCLVFLGVSLSERHKFSFSLE